MRTKAYWFSLAIFMAFGTTVDWVAIHWTWWEWSPVRTCGLHLLNIPIEEFILFIVGHMTLVVAWETLDDLA